MSRVISVALLLMVLVDNFYDSTASHAEFHVTKAQVRKCRCQVLPRGQLRCPYPLLPRSHAKKLALVKCFCSKKKQHKFPEFQATCKTLNPNVLINPL